MNQLIEQTLIEQNPHWEGVLYSNEYKRLYNKQALADLKLREIGVITGIRRCGKSTLLQSLIDHLITEKNPKCLLYINLDDPNYMELSTDASALQSIVVTAEKLTGCAIEYLFLDEAQNMTAWEKYVKSIYDSKRFTKVYVTGSNAELLKSQYAKLLSGRYLETHVYPLRFQERLINVGIIDNYLLVKRKAEVLAQLDEAMLFGGFPRIFGIKEIEVKRKILKNYYETILLKDCIANHSIRDVKSFMSLTHYLISNISSLYSYNSLSKIIEKDEATIQNFIQFLENSYIFEEIKNFSYSLKSQLKSKKKIYCIDNGLINATTFKFSNNYGKLLENLVYSELKKKYETSIYFYHGTVECDFIIHNNDKIAIQVCYQLDNENREREIKGLKVAMEEFSIPTGLIVTYNQEEIISDNMRCIPFWKWCVD